MTTKIQWTQEVWNPFVGCSKISPGCQNCYAIKEAHRLSWNTNEKIRQKYAGTVKFNGSFNWTGEINFSEEALTLPLRWKKPRMIFVNSMSDLFHENVPDEWVDRVFAVMALCPQHTFQVLTKRADRMLAYMQRLSKSISPLEAAARELGQTFFYEGFSLLVWPIRNLWLGVSVENQQTADGRIPLLLQTPAAIRWISAEPLLDSIDLLHDNGLQGWDYLRGWNPHVGEEGRNTSRVDWVVCGGESGHNARPFNIEWARQIISQCRAANVPVFCKQLGAKSYEIVGGKVSMLCLKNKKGGDISEWPEDLRIRQFPEVSHA